MFRKLLRWLFGLYWAVVLTVLSLQVHYPMGEAARGADCLPECMDPTEQWGFPLLYIQETFVTSVGRAFHLWLFLGNVLFYGVLLGGFLSKHTMSRPHLDKLIEALFWPLMWFLLLSRHHDWLLVVVAARVLWHVVRARKRGSAAGWLSMGLVLAGGVLLSHPWPEGRDPRLWSAWAALLWSGLNLPVQLQATRLLLHLGVALLTGLWWYTLIDGPFLAALGTHLAGSTLMWWLFGVWLSMFMAPQLLMACLERWKVISGNTKKQPDERV